MLRLMKLNTKCNGIIFVHVHCSNYGSSWAEALSVRNYCTWRTGVFELPAFSTMYSRLPPHCCCFLFLFFFFFLLWFFFQFLPFSVTLIILLPTLLCPASPRISGPPFPHPHPLPIPLFIMWSKVGSSFFVTKKLKYNSPAGAGGFAVPVTNQWEKNCKNTFPENRF